MVWDGWVGHYAAREHALEIRARLDGQAWDEWRGGGGFLVGLSVHSVARVVEVRRAGVPVTASMTWATPSEPLVTRPRSLAGGQWSCHAGPTRQRPRCWASIARADYDGAERELAECVLCVTPGSVEPWVSRAPDGLVAAARAGTWQGRANQLSRARTDWDVVEAVAQATAYPGRVAPASDVPVAPPVLDCLPGQPAEPSARQILLQRRSAVAFDPRGWLSRASFARVLARLKPVGVPWDVADWPACAQLVLFVHRVQDVTPGLYAFVRDPAGRDASAAGHAPRVPVGARALSGHDDLEGLYLLVPADVTWTAARLSCDQDIAAECAFSLGMLVPMASSLEEQGPWAYRRLFWECGLIGQVLYLEAEAGGVRGTGSAATTTTRSTTCWG